MPGTPDSFGTLARLSPAPPVAGCGRLIERGSPGHRARCSSASHRSRLPGLVPRVVAGVRFIAELETILVRSPRLKCRLAVRRRGTPTKSPLPAVPAGARKQGSAPQFRPFGASSRAQGLADQPVPRSPGAVAGSTRFVGVSPLPDYRQAVARPPSFVTGECRNIIVNLTAVPLQGAHSLARRPARAPRSSNIGGADRACSVRSSALSQPPRIFCRCSPRFGAECRRLSCPRVSAAAKVVERVMQPRARRSRFGRSVTAVLPVNVPTVESMTLSIE